MDSMRSLNTSLPGSPSLRHRRRRRVSLHHQQQQQQQPQAPSGEILQAFRAAALSVTQLYKTADMAQEEIRSRSLAAGYQDALEDLLDFLDQKNLGLEDGEGWRVREWATRRHASSVSSTSSMSSARARSRSSSGGSAERADMRMEEAPRETRSESPSGHGGLMNEDQTTLQPESTGGARASSSPPIPAAETPRQMSPENSRNDHFTFRSTVPMPPASDFETSNPTNPPPTFRLELRPRQMRNARHGHIGREQRPRGLAMGAMGHGAGVKRRYMSDDFFDLADISGNWTDFGGSGGSGHSAGFGPVKKGRFS